MLTRSLVSKLFETSTMQRWTDHARPVPFTILGKHAHMVTAAWVYGRSLEMQLEPPTINWTKLVDYAVYELLRKAVLTDIKSQVFRDLNKDESSRQALLGYVQGSLREDLTAVSPASFDGFVQYFDAEIDDPDSLGLEYKLLRCASNYATRWEYQIISEVDKVKYITDTRRALDDEKAQYGKFLPKEVDDLEPDKLAKFLDLCGRLRFQDRWSQTPIVPRRPVMDHQLVVATLAHLSTRQLKIGDARTYNNFFGALFHDLGEILTRDIVSPIKNISSEVKRVIDDFEKTQYDKHIDTLVPQKWRPELRRMVLNPFVQDIDYDGEFVKACDTFAAFLEAYYSVKYGTYSPELKKALLYLYESRRKRGPIRPRADHEDSIDPMTFDVAYELCFYEIEPQIRRI
ncbi:MAG: HD domain-containing protein [Coriobacteriia bacterium]|nr:HD domain-containing protein [Coriobacteriia bacterium]